MIETADAAPTHDQVTDYDRAHLRQYLRLLDANAALASWEDASETILDADPQNDPDRARRRYDSHLARARWMADSGYLDLLRSGKP